MKYLKRLVIASSLLTTPALAGGVNIQTFNPASAGVFETMESAFLDRGAFDEKTDRLDFNFGLHYHFADNPLVEYDPTVTNRTAVLVDGLHTMQLTGGIQQKDWGINLIIQAHEVKLAGASYTTAFGDTRLQGKIHVAQSEDDQRAFAVVPEIYLPTGNSDLFVSNGGFGFGLRAVVQQNVNRFRFGASLGYVTFDSGTFRNIDYRNQMPYSLAAAYLLNEKWGFNAEFSQSLTFPRNSLQNPGELYLGSKLKLQKDLIATGGVSLGGFDFQKSNDIRIHFGLEFKLNADRNAEDRLPASRRR